jgi:hypothetical protein
VPEDDRAVMERLAALEAEVKADADKQRARKDTAMAKLREQRAVQQAESDSLRERQTSIVKAKPVKVAASAEPISDDDAIGGALQLARRAHGVKQELEKKGDKSWVKSGLASMLLGPLGWLYAGSLREAVPASVGWLAFGALATKIIPMFLLMPVLLVALPLSGIAGVVYAMQFNRTGKRQRLFNKDSKKPKQLPR